MSSPDAAQKQVRQLERELVERAGRLDPDAEVGALLNAAATRARSRSEVRKASTEAGVDEAVLRKRLEEAVERARPSVELGVLDLERLRAELLRAEQEVEREAEQPRGLRVLTAVTAIGFMIFLLVLLVALVALAITAVTGDGTWIFRWLGWLEAGIATAILGVLSGALGALQGRHTRRVESTDVARRRDSLHAQIDARREGIVQEVVDEQLVPELTKALNELRAPSYEMQLELQSSAGLSEPLNPRLEVPTPAKTAIERRLSTWSGGSLGVSGPRGIGKTTLLEAICRTQEESHESPTVAVLVSAPVQYQPREFVLHLFAEFCGAVLEAYRVPRAAAKEVLDRNTGVGGSRGLVGALDRVYVRPLRRILFGGPVVSREHAAESLIASTAAERLQEIQFQQTYTSGWGGGLTSAVAVKFERGQSFERTAMSYPEVVRVFRDFVQQVATKHRVVIAIDEMDKMGSREEAKTFLNDIKGIFGIRNCFFLLSVSEEAMSAFERRGLPIRDAFDSAFDDIIAVEYLDFAASSEMLRRRVLGLPVPFLALSHCLSGGLPRELLRFARVMAEIHEVSGERPLREVSKSLVSADLAKKTTATEIAARTLLEPHGANEVLEVTRELRPTPGSGDFDISLQRVRKIAAALVVAGDDPRATDLALELTAYAYFVVSITEFFCDELDQSRLEAAIDPDAGEDSIELLAEARQAFAVDAYEAWDLITRFRTGWRLEVVDPPARPQHVR
jgi:Cdc6-like AAA superfamily ATPase